MLGLAARLPDALVGLVPDLDRALDLVLDDRPQPLRDMAAHLRVQIDRVEHGAEDVVLLLVVGAVADPHGPRALVAAEVVERRLGQVAFAADPVHDLQAAVAVTLEVGDELHEVVGLPVEAERVQPPEREGRVAHPAVAVVPVALALRGLRQRGRRRRDGRTGGGVGEALERERRAVQMPHASDGPGSVRRRASRASSARCSRAAPPRPRGRAGPPVRAPNRARRIGARPRPACGVHARGCPRSRGADRSAGAA